MRTIERSVDLPLSADAVWALLQRGETFLYVARGVLGVANPEAVRGELAVGRCVRLQLRLFHVLPAGWHELTIAAVDPVRHTIRTQERSPLLRIWNHTLSVVALDRQRSRYTDRIEFDAGPLTAVAAPLVSLFFAHRQRRWRRLARQQAVHQG